MRALLIVLILVFVFVFASFFTEAFIKNSIDDFIKDVENIYDEKNLKTATEKWEKLSDYFEIIIDHGDLEEVSQHLWAMEKELKYDLDEFMESKALALQMLEHIKQRNTIGLVNVL